MFYDIYDVYFVVIVDGINFCFFGLVQELVDQDMVVWKVFENVQDMLFQFFIIDDDLYLLFIEYIRWVDECWVICFVCSL